MADLDFTIPRNLKDISGQIFGRLTVIQYGSRRGRKTRWLCRCECGKEVVVYKDQLQSGQTQSCGCLQREKTAEGNRTHGRSGTREHSIWLGMLTRCRNPRNRSYHNYGGRGIFVCERWQDFENFYADMGERPIGTSLDRIDNDGPYSPENCRWASRGEQALNRSNTMFLTFRGETMSLKDWGERLNMKPPTIFMRLRKGWSVNDALGTPVLARRMPSVITFNGRSGTFKQWAGWLGLQYGTLKRRAYVSSIEEAIGNALNEKYPVDLSGVCICRSITSEAMLYAA